jgi:hypothetical protein
MSDRLQVTVENAKGLLLASGCYTADQLARLDSNEAFDAARRLLDSQLTNLDAEPATRPPPPKDRFYPFGLRSEGLRRLSWVVIIAAVCVWTLFYFGKPRPTNTGLDVWISVFIAVPLLGYAIVYLLIKAGSWAIAHFNPFSCKTEGTRRLSLALSVIAYAVWTVGSAAASRRQWDAENWLLTCVGVPLITFIVVRLTLSMVRWIVAGFRASDSKLDRR